MTQARTRANEVGSVSLSQLSLAAMLRALVALVQSVVSTFQSHALVEPRGRAHGSMRATRVRHPSPSGEGARSARHHRPGGGWPSLRSRTAARAPEPAPIPFRRRNQTRPPRCAPKTNAAAQRRPRSEIPRPNPAAQPQGSRTYARSLSWAARSVFSHEKPPSLAGSRPKWP